MDRLTKFEIQHALLSGEAITWRNTAGKFDALQLGNPEQRRLFAFLLESRVREPKGLSDSFIKGLAVAYLAEGDPASQEVAGAEPSAATGPWRLLKIETEGFGGVNTFAGPPFALELDEDSLLLQGPNGSGKPSLVGAVLWAMTGNRPREHSGVKPEERAEVFDAENRVIGAWPPVACYPDDLKGLSTNPFVRVSLIFVDANGNTARVERQLKDGELSYAQEPLFNAPDILVETGLLMPSRMSHIRFEKGQTALTAAVQRLTGLDDLADIGLLADGLCNRGREYLATNARELQRHKSLFQAALAEARRSIEPAGEQIEVFSPKDTETTDGPLAMLGKRLRRRATELTQVIAEDLAEGLDLTSNKVQHQVAGAIAGALEDLSQGLMGLPSWRVLTDVATAAPKETAAQLTQAVAEAELAVVEAQELDEQARRDTRMRLKALGAHWHEVHRHGEVADCPLCDKPLEDQALKAEIDVLRRSGEAATRKLTDNINAILAQLDAVIPNSVAKKLQEVGTFAPRRGLINDITKRLVTRDRYGTYLSRFTQLVSSALSEAPTGELGVQEVADGAEAHPTAVVTARIASVRQVLLLAQWYRDNGEDWSAWWEAVSEGGTPPMHRSSHQETRPTEQTESLRQHLARLSDAIGDATPYRAAAEALGRAWQSGREARRFEKEQERREAIAAQLAPLKALGKMAEAQARLAIEGLSEDISEILQRIHLSERLAFKGTRLQPKVGILVDAGFHKSFKIDATLVANTSWLRAVLWAFLFALRREAVKQLGRDPFPLLVFDDPQATFDAEHRHRWVREIVNLQQGVQLLITTHDENFLELAKIDGIKGREGIIVASGPELGHIGVFEGAALYRRWTKAQTENTPAAAQDYIAAVRVYVEGLLRLMLRGESYGVTSAVSGFVLGRSRDTLRRLHNASSAPWDKSEFNSLVGQLDNGTPAIKYMEMSHHASRLNLGMAEAVDVEQHWRKSLAPALHRAFMLARDHQLLHGGLRALHAPPPNRTLPNGYTAEVRAFPLQVVGRAAALSGGRVADGRLDLELGAIRESLVLGRHKAFRLNAPTLEPVARRGDILLVREIGEPSSRSLVVAQSEDRIVARRFEIADNHSDVAVLSAQSVNPRQIAPPIVVKKATLTLCKVIGVLFESDALLGNDGDDEVCDCGGAGALRRYSSDMKGVVEVAGHSAEPIALDGQLLLIGSSLTADNALSRLGGRPVIASDEDGSRYFKRLRYGSAKTVVLESLEISGDYPPVVLTHKTGAPTDLGQVWPVLGVLFERP